MHGRAATPVKHRYGRPDAVDAMRLLLCDDHRVFAESLALVLDEAGYEIVAVTYSAEEALVSLRTQPVDVCIVDAGHAPVLLSNGPAGLPGVAPDVEVVVLSAPASRTGPAALDARIRGIVSTNQSISDIIETIERVGAGRPPPRSRPRPAQLTGREREALSLLVRGAHTDTVATAMGVTQATARSHIRSILAKLGAHTRVEAAATAVRLGLVDAETGEWLPE
jgi:two-component system, NarL family, nitrate/nitrite response regulator NarL